MFMPSERAGVFGWYLFGPIFGPTAGPIFGGLIVEHLGWRWIFWVLSIVCFTNTLAAFFLLKESYAPAILAARKASLQASSAKKFYYPNEDLRPLHKKLGVSLRRPLRILFSQPIVFTMASYQAVLYGTMYALYVRFPAIFGSNPYHFSSDKVGLFYLGPGLGFFLAVMFVIPRIDTVFNHLTRRHDGVSKPEYRLPLANIGAVLIPLSLFWFAWCVEKEVHWGVAIASMPLYGLGQQVVFNAVQNYYIDSFEKYAASAIAAGAVFRAVVGGVIPLIAPTLFDALGYGWGISLLAFLAVALAPSPLLFYIYGQGLRERFAIEL